MKASAPKIISYVYLLLIPFIGAVLAFGVGHVSYKIYLPIWVFNTGLMVLASWSLGLKVIRSGNEENGKLAKTAFCLIVPVIIVSMFVGLGPPPESAAEWVATSTEQQVRYFMLVITGVIVAYGFLGLRNRLKAKGENHYSLIGVTAVLIAIPLFIINMLYWGFYLSELFKIQVNSHAADPPEWYLPVKQLFGLISVVEVALIYFGTIAIVMGLRKAGLLSKPSGFIYILISLFALVVIILSGFFGGTIRAIGDKVSIPVFPFLVAYFIAVNLLRKLGTNYRADYGD